MDPLIPAAAGVTGLVFAGLVAAKWRKNRRAHDALWAAGLFLYGVVSFVEAWVMTSGWTIPLYRTYFVMSPALVGLLGAGTIRFVADAKWSRLFTALVAGLVLVAAIGQLFLVIHIDTPVTADGVTKPLDEWGSELGGRAIPFPHPARIAFLLLNIVGGLALILGALWSWWTTKRLGVLLIGVGALFPFTGGTLSTLGFPEGRIIAQLIGIVIMFAGFVKSQEPFPAGVKGMGKPA